MLADLYERRPLRFAVHVDGRPVGESFMNNAVAQMYADDLYHQAPWAVVEVVAGY